MFKVVIFGKSFFAILTMFVFAGIGFSPVVAYASMIGLPDASNLGIKNGRSENIFIFADIELPPTSTNANIIMLPPTGIFGNKIGKPDHVPPVNPPVDTPAFYNGLVNTPAIMPANVPSHTLPGSGFGQAVVPVPAAVWLFGSGLLGLVGIARRKKAAQS